MKYYTMKQCYICTQSNKKIEWQNKDFLKRFLSPEYKILPPKVSGNCSKCQRKVARAIKKARILSIVPYSSHINK